jgi:hypothetical protein
VSSLVQVWSSPDGLGSDGFVGGDTWMQRGWFRRVGTIGRFSVMGTVGVGKRETLWLAGSDTVRWN